MRLLIEPTEPMLFRTARPFGIGENNFAESLFPPTPETFQGALRALLAVHLGRTASDLFNDPAVVELIGRREEKDEGWQNVYGRFRITGLTLGYTDPNTRKVSRLFPAPAHFMRARVEENNQEKDLLVRLVPEAIPTGLCNFPGELPAGLGSAPEQMTFPAPKELNHRKTTSKSEPLAGWLTPLGLRRALSQYGLPEPDEQELVGLDARTRAEKRRAYLFSGNDIFQHEARLGIGIESTRKTTREGYLYQTQLIRMQPHFGFVVDLALGESQHGSSPLPVPEKREDDPDVLAFLYEGGWLTLGGEQRAAYVRALTPDECVQEDGLESHQAGNLLYFATPAFFEGGWLPRSANLLPARLLTAAINRAQPIGGWQLEPGSARGGSKRIRRCIPAGSIYYFDQDARVTVERPLTEYGWQIGYGLAYTGVY